MIFFKTILNIREVLYPLLLWILIFVIFWMFSWFYNEPVDTFVYLVPLFVIVSIYLGFKFNVYDEQKNFRLKKSNFFLTTALMGFFSVIYYLIKNLKNLGKDLSEVRADHLENVKIGLQDTLYSIFFPFLIISFIVANFNNLKHKNVINIFAFLSCLIFIPINGGRVNFIVFGSLYASIYLFKNHDVIIQNRIYFFLKFLALFVFTAIIGTIYGILRVSESTDKIINYLSTLNYINENALLFLLRLPNDIGIFVVLFIAVFYDYTGANVYYLHIFLNNSHKLNYLTYGFYNFNFLDRFNTINFLKVHNDIDNLYIPYDIKQNVWSTFIRDFSVDFGLLGSFFVLTLMSSLLFYSRNYISKSYSAQVLFFLLFAFLLITPFHSLFFLSRTYAIAFFLSLIGFLKFKLFK
jgi:hypothetical protein